MLESYIISTKTKINGKFEAGFFEGLLPSTNKHTMNVFTTHQTIDRNKAKIFFDQEEAKRMAAFISRKDLTFATVEPLIKSKTSEPAKPVKVVDLEKIETALRNAVWLINNEYQSVCDDSTKEYYDNVIAESEDALKEFA